MKNNNHALHDLPTITFLSFYNWGLVSHLKSFGRPFKIFYGGNQTIKIKYK
jgi:hypothetical protein